MKRSLCVLSLLLLVMLLLACAALAVPAPKPSLKEWGDPVNPDQDCRIRRDEGVLSIEMPGIEHDYDPALKRFNAPRILREIEGEFDLRVRIRIYCPPSARSSVEGQPAYVSAGFLIILPDAPWREPWRESACERLDYGVIQQRVGIDDFTIRIDDSDERRRLAYLKFAEGLRRLAHPQIEKESRKAIGEDGCVIAKDWVYNSAAIENGGPIIGCNRFRQISLVFFDRGWRDWPLQGKADCVYLRMEHKGKGKDKGIVFSISPDGVKWTPVWGGTLGLPAKTKVGLAAYSTSAEPSKVRFDQIRFWRGKKKKR